MIEVSIKVSDDSSSLVKKHLLHEEGLSLSHDDAILAAWVNEAIEEFKGNVDDVVIKTKFTW